MTIAEIGADEPARLEELRRYRILDTDPEPAFDRITELAIALFSVPIALVSLVDERRQWFKSCVGLTARETDRDVAFCAHAILHDDPLVIPDAREDARFRDNPLVTGAPHIRFYAGAPLVTPRGQRIGTLCVIDTAPRALDAKGLHRLQSLSRTVVDMLELHARTAELDLAKREMVAILDSMDEIVVARDREHRALIVNRAAKEAFGERGSTRDPSSWVAGAQAYSPELTPLSPERLPIVRALAGETVRAELIALRPAPDEVRYFTINATPVFDTNRRVIGGVAVGRDVTEERRLQELERLSARTDALTGLYKRRALVEFAEKLLPAADRRNGKPTSVALFDLDHFQRINDTGGHDVGDAVLREVAGVLRSQARVSDIVVRWGGEELLVMLPDCSADGARRYAERVRAEVERLEVERAGAITISAGVIDRMHGEDLEAAVARADTKLYEAKRAGRNRVC